MVYTRAHQASPQSRIEHIILSLACAGLSLGSARSGAKFMACCVREIIKKLIGLHGRAGAPSKKLTGYLHCECLNQEAAERKRYVIIRENISQRASSLRLGTHKHHNNFVIMTLITQERIIYTKCTELNRYKGPSFFILYLYNFYWQSQPICKNLYMNK